VQESTEEEAAVVVSEASIEELIEELIGEEALIEESIEEAIGEGALREESIEEGASREEAIEEEASREEAIEEGASREEAIEEGASREEAIEEGALREVAKEEGALREVEVREAAIEADTTFLTTLNKLNKLWDTNHRTKISIIILNSSLTSSIRGTKDRVTRKIISLITMGKISSRIPGTRKRKKNKSRLSNLL
jgi:hypothetical protein